MISYKQIIILIIIKDINIIFDWKVVAVQFIVCNYLIPRLQNCVLT